MTESPSKMNQEACAWIVKMHDAELSLEQKEALKQWMNQSSAHKSELRRMAKRWEQLNVLTELAVPVDSHGERHFLARSLFSNIFSSLVSGGAAISVIVLVVALFVMRPIDIAQDTQTYTTAIGEQRLITLSDQSTILLNTDSVIQVNYSRALRAIHLMQGEAHFDVSSNLDRPFRVHAGKGVVRAVGTAFSVRLKSKSVEVFVTEGIVEVNSIQNLTDIPTQSSHVEPDHEPAIVKAGQAATFDRVVETIELVENLNTPEISSRLSWHDGLLKFSGDPLEDVVAEISRYTSLNIVIPDPQLRNLRVGGLFKVGETRKMFEVLEVGFGVSATQVDENTVHLTASSGDESL
jgi:transmembrane sensor